jgi:mannobiose 2-epimerase
MNTDKLNILKTELKSELISNILPYWGNKMVDNENGGFYGCITGKEQVLNQAEKGGILNARILWTFSSAYILLKDPALLKIADRAKVYILENFTDKTFGGTYWSIKYNGEPSDTKKQIYSQAFFIYALSEYYRATGDNECLSASVGLFHLIEKYSFDNKNNGYFESYSREWKLLDDLRLSKKDANEKKTMNTHLHVLEAYTNLYRVWKHKELAVQLENLIILFLDKFLDSKTNHLNLFFDESWNCKSSIVSYGHDIEASWLIHEAALVLGKETLTDRTGKSAIMVAEAASEGIQNDGGLIYEKNNTTGHIDYDRHWWPQAEAIVGYVNAFELTKNEKFLDKALNSWNFIKNNLIDTKNGEWFWSIKADGSVNHEDDKAGFWKCPYHNSRACIEIIKREV